MPRTPTRIGGVDPAVIRELSGIYKPFANAFKELISNSYDADADRVEIRLAEDYTEIEIYDDGRGLTPDEFRTDFTKIGGSQTRVREELTAKQRPKIGSKGIGFLAVARYCSRMEIASASGREYKATVRCPVQRRKIHLLEQIESPIPKDLLLSRIRIEAIYPLAGRRLRRLGKDHNVIQSDGCIDFSNDFRSKEWVEVEVEYSIDCSDLEFNATIDFEYLLSLENKKDLEEIEDFCSLEVKTLPADGRDREKHYTRITLKGLKDSVVRNLKTGRKHGNVRNIESRSGIDRFIWHLRRSIPARYALPEPVRRKFGKGNLTSPDIKYIQGIIFSGPGYNEVELTRPVWSSEDKSTLCLDDDICIEVDLNAEGVVAKGYILASSEIIYPAEFRGIAVRVRNVQIGEPGFLGFERVATGFIKSALSQITGEINVIHGLDAIDALNPGRESFYEENTHFKLLQSHVVGDKETVGGLLKKVIDGLEKRMQVSSAVEDQLSRANQRRKALLSIAMAVTHFSRHAGGGLKKLFSDNTNHSNGLAMLPKSEVGPGRTIQNFRVEERVGQESYTTDFINRIIYIDPEHDRWSRKISLLGEVYEVVPTNGSDEDPLCQLDLDSKKIFVNWGHPLRQQMGEAAFLKSSVAWRVAYHASQGDIENMMELYLKLLTYNES